MGKHKNSKQKKIFSDFMEDHQDLARNSIKGNRIQADAMWANLAEKLNREGPPQKTIYGWKKVWSDWKGHIKKKLMQNKTRATGPVLFNAFGLTAVEEKIAQVCAMYDSLNGIQKTEPYGIPFTEVLVIDDSETDDENNEDTAQSTPNVNNDLRFLKRRREETLQNMLTNHLQSEVSSTGKIAGSLANIQEILSERNSLMYRAIEKQNRHLQENNQLHREHFKAMEKIAHERNVIKQKQLDLDFYNLKKESEEYFPAANRY